MATHPILFLTFVDASLILARHSCYETLLACSTNFCKFDDKAFIMTEIIIDKKKYVLIPEKSYQALQKKAALKIRPEKTFTVEQARTYTKKMIRVWAAEK